MVLDFPILADYAVLPVGRRLVYATHGHVHNLKNLPPLAPGDVLLHGHTHIPAWTEFGEGNLYLNPGSVSIPKEGSAHSYMTLEGEHLPLENAGRRSVPGAGAVMGAMELEEKTVQIRDDFDPDKILESGQCFRPRKQAEGWYRFVSGRQLLYLRPLRSGTYTVRCEPGAWETFWHGYFDLGRSYAALRGKLDSRDDFLQRAMEYGRGIRVLRQDEWEMLVSFIISQRKSIPAIRRAVELLSERFGERLGSDSEGPVYAFPTAEALCCAGEQALQECGLGYRTRYVLHAAQQAAEGTLDLKKLASPAR